MRIAIVGGGLGGLAAALFLRRAGIEATVYEQSQQLREVGAGIVVSPNMVRPLERLGLLPQLEACAVRLEAAWEFRRWQDGRVLSVQAMAGVCHELYGAHCYVAHRADLMAILQSALPADRLRLDHRCINVDQGEDAVDLTFSNHAGEQSRITVDAVIGADGIHSALRPLVAPSSTEPRFSGLCAFRCLVPSSAAPAMALRPVHTLWLGPDHHFVHYLISAGRLVNVVAMAPAREWRTESWNSEGSVDDLMREFDGWDPRVTQLIASATDTKRWALYDREPLGTWTRGRIALMGDAAHAMLPFYGQGAAQAIEDAEALGACLTGVGSDAVPQALKRYEDIRLPRTSKVLLMSRGREVVNHLHDGPEQKVRDAGFAAGDPLRQSAWLYGHDA